MSNVFPLDPGTGHRSMSMISAPGADVIVDMDGGADPEFDPETGTVQIPLADGSVEISWGAPEKKRETDKFDDNIALNLDETELSTIAERLLRGIDQDIQTRSAWLENMSNGISLLGLEIKNPRGAAASGATPQEGTSTVDHPLLLEAVLRFQANARGELLPTDGPVKVRNDGTKDSLAGILSKALEDDLNHFLTVTAKEYVPDTDRMLLMLGFSGISFKKGGHHPIKRRPVIESIDAKDLIVSNAATDIEGAGRVTHRVWMRPSIMKRMQLLGAYRDITLPSPGTPSLKDAVDQKISQVQGIAPQTYLEAEDQDRELFECYCEIEVPGFEHKLDGKQTGLPLPYKVTIDREARRILEIRRNWVEDDEFCMPRNRIIAYIFIPGLGFYGIGLLNILGNATKAVTAAWRLMIDAGMFANFPGFLYLKSMAKQLTNQFRVPPGGGMPIDTTGSDIRSAIMPLPYKDPSPVFIQLIDNIASTAQRVGGTAEMQIGEGKQDAPVGTTLAMIEQATKLMSAVHKRLHYAQGQEFGILKELLMEDPSALWRHNKKSKVLEILVQQAGLQPVVDQEMAAEEQHHKLFLAALADCELIPKADPNTSSQTERYLKVVALRNMAATNPQMDLVKIDQYAIRVMGIDDGDGFFKPPAPPGSEPPPPEAIMAEATKTAADARLLDSQTKAKEAELKAQTAASDAQAQQAALESKERIASLGVARELVIHNADQEAGRHELGMDTQNRAMDRIHKLAMATAEQRTAADQAAAQRAHEAQQANVGLAHKSLETGLARQHDATQAGLGRQHDVVTAGMDQNADLAATGLQQHHVLATTGLDQAHDLRATGLAQQHEATQAEADRKHEAEQSALDRKAAAAKPKAKPKGKK